MGRTDSVADTWGSIDPIILVIGVIFSVVIAWLYIRANRPPWTKPLDGTSNITVVATHTPRPPRTPPTTMVICLRPICGHIMFDEWPTKMRNTTDFGKVWGRCSHCKGFGYFEVRALGSD